MTTKQSRKEIAEEALTNRDELRRALIGELDKDVGDGFLDALILLCGRKYETWPVLKAAAYTIIDGLEDIAISYANSVNIQE